MSAAHWHDHRPRRQAFVARQPIFDMHAAVFGYELLYRSGIEEQYRADDDDLASLAVISDSAFVFGLETLAGPGRAFVNFTQNSLVREYARVLPPDRLVVEVRSVLNRPHAAAQRVLDAVDPVGVGHDIDSGRRRLGDRLGDLVRAELGLERITSR